MLPVNRAESVILAQTRSLDPQQDTEVVNLETGVGRVLAMSVRGSLDFPYWDNSAMDGYAVKYEDVQECDRDHPVNLELVEEIPAGYQPTRSLQSGQAARIFTGGMLPEGADTVVMQENTERVGNSVKILASSQAQEFVRHRGAFYRAGEPLLLPGIVLDAPEIAVLATAQCTQLTVYRRPRVAILSTGDELVTPEQSLQPGQIVDSNGAALAAFVARNGGIPIRMGIVQDQPDAIKKAIAQAVDSADIVLSTGGVSVGDYDYVEEILEQLGAKIQVRSVAIKPGKPLKVATFANGCLYFGIPGNPVSALVSCWRFVLPALKKLAGIKDNWQPRFVKARSRFQLRGGGKRETYLWGSLYLVDGSYEFEPAGGSHSSGNLINLAQTNGLAVLPVGQTFIPEGGVIEVMQVG